MASALRQLPTGVRSTPARLRATARPKARVSSYHVAAATRTRRRGAVGARTLPVGPRQYWVRAGEDELSEESKKKLDEETRINLGKTISTLKDRLPTILQQPLPSDILAPNISLHLFPSTHPHLPVANGKAAYKAALWTSPLAWNRVPIIGNVGIEVLTVRMQTAPLPFAPARLGSLDEVMLVRWATEPESVPSEFLRDMAARISRGGEKTPHVFTGLFAFQFDVNGRVLDHTIESAEHSRHWGKGVGSSVVRFTDRVLGGIRHKGDPDPLPMPACWKRGGRGD